MAIRAALEFWFDRENYAVPEPEDGYEEPYTAEEVDRKLEENDAFDSGRWGLEIVNILLEHIYMYCAFYHFVGWIRHSRDNSDLGTDAALQTEKIVGRDGYYERAMGISGDMSTALDRLHADLSRSVEAQLAELAAQ